MLQRIISIKNVGRFQNCDAMGDVTFRRFTLVFAENGRGKTTLCAILRSLFTNTPAFIIGRKTLGSMESPEVQLLLGNGNTTFRNGAWSAAFSDIALFDGVYVSENVFAGDVIDTEHRRNLYRVIIGAPGVKLAGSLNDLAVQIKAKNTEIRDNRTRMQRHVPAGMTVEAFMALSTDAAIDAKIAVKEQELQAVRRAAQLQQRASLAAVAVPVFPTAFAELLGKTFANVAKDAERRVEEHIAGHGMQAHGEAWLTEGLQYASEDSCPFCGQQLKGVELIQAYREFFSREIPRATGRSDRLGQTGGWSYRGACGGGNRPSTFTEQQRFRILAAVLHSCGAEPAGSWQGRGRNDGTPASRTVTAPDQERNAA